MATLHDLLKARFAMVRQDLNEVLGRLRDEDLDEAPREGMRTVRGLLQEIADKEVETRVWIVTGVWPDDYAGAFDERASLAEIQKRLVEIRAETYAYLDALSEEDLNRSIPCPDRWWEALRLTECPLSEILRNVAAHEWYHTGQLVTTLWTRGDDPNAW